MSTGLLVADSEFFTSLGSSSGEHSAAVFGGHSGAKAVFVDPLPFAGLESRLHAGILL